MLNWLKKNRQKQNSQVSIKEVNQKRFISIYTDKRFNHLEEIFNRLKKNDLSLTNDEILKSYFKFSDAMQSNTFAIGEIEFAVVSQICCYKPDLAEKLLEKGIMAVIYSYGNEIDYKDVLFFIDKQILKEDTEPYGGLPNEKGIIWLNNLASHKKLVKKVLAKMIKQNINELNEIDDK